MTTETRTRTISDYFVPADMPAISKRSNVGRRAHELLSSPEYNAVIGNNGTGWGSTLIRFTVKSQYLLQVNVTNYLTTVRPKEKNYRGDETDIERSVYVITDGVYSVDYGWMFVEGACFQYDVKTDEVVITPFATNSSSEYAPSRTDNVGEFGLTPSAWFAERITEHEEAERKRAERLATIAALTEAPVPFREKVAVNFAQDFLKAFSEKAPHDVRPAIVNGKHWDVNDELRRVREQQVEVIVYALCRYFLLVVHKTTLEVNLPVSNAGWGDDNFVHHRINADEAASFAVHNLVRSPNTDDVSVDLFGLAVKRFYEVLKAY